uniref:Sulfotransferase domain-containing protein n=1 Tax=Heliothis virescens TaxID=7102 RepID=A0A2A4KAH9_HELVI
MAEEKRVSFPFDYKEIEPEEKAKNKRLFNYPNIDFIRVGPKGYVMLRPYLKHAEDIYNLPIRPSDVFVASYQRSGTTWTQELVWLISNNFDYATALAAPITHRYPFLEIYMYFDEWRKNSLKNIDKVDSIEKKEKLLKMLEVMAQPVTEKLAAMPSPRFIKTHLPMCFLPPTIVDTAKMLYIARDPRDIAVSSYHHARLFKVLDFAGEFKDFWNLFINGRYILTPYFEHVKEAWNMRHHPNMLFLFYEELKKDLPAVIRRVAAFLNKQVTEKQMTKLCEHLSFDNFKKNKAVNYEDLREFDVFTPNETFIRKGKTNGWRDYFDDEMTQQAEKWIQDNLRDTDLRFPHMKH